MNEYDHLILMEDSGSGFEFISRILQHIVPDLKVVSTRGNDGLLDFVCWAAYDCNSAFNVVELQGSRLNQIDLNSVDKAYIIADSLADESFKELVASWEGLINFRVCPKEYRCFESAILCFSDLQSWFPWLAENLRESHTKAVKCLTDNDLDSLLDIPEMRGRTYEEAVARFLGLIVQGHRNWKLGKSLGIGSCWLHQCCPNSMGESLEKAGKHFSYCDANPDYLSAGVSSDFKVNAYITKSPIGVLIKDIGDFFNIPGLSSLLVS